MFRVFNNFFLFGEFKISKNFSSNNFNLFIFENFLFIHHLSSCNFYVTGASYNVNFTHSDPLTFLFFLNLQVNLSDLYLSINRYELVNSSNSSVITSFRSLMRNFTLNFAQNLNCREVLTLSNYFSAFTWLERELKEFSGIEICGLKDSRRLLTDYGHTDNLTSTPYYNLLLQVII